MHRPCAAHIVVFEGIRRLGGIFTQCAQVPGEILESFEAAFGVGHIRVREGLSGLIRTPAVPFVFERRP
ncbi:hypothetical protein A5780_24630 [Nocardia sp. 852002-20019_SCH5090214]|uniref:Uncharacterized protein n=1 Tax=Nocardia nova TaxID=37330 RepID=A0A2S6AAN0_9NOCA|nr:hypothetical protein A5789_17210 [Nocardia sp. 852002-51101_SCH5132738]OBA55957.1 hypothetical protein A5780_24630 [Nocardia sp. 852002-20019_SCH5090214]OBF84636.1 hypothetical protein A9X06_14770 [Mycobacterium sp. 852002-51759_SCH5129042]PPI97138.1 hypothetical protein C5E46_16180 [Nocardia nova]PPJ07844.1 hypothetical protein C5E51_16875 [Nocardia nova]